MAYRLRPEERLSRALARVAAEQIRGALSSVAKLEDNSAARVHKSRQHMKKLRALFRLIRPELERAGTFKLHDGLARDAARALATQRDAHVMLTTLELLERQHRWAVDESSLARIRKHLSRGAGKQRSARQLRRAARKCSESLGQLSDLLDEWRFRSGARKTVQSGYLRTWRSARRQMEAASSNGAAEDFHEWRKHVKYHMYHLRLVSGIVEEDLARKERDAYRLQKLLGEHHDLAILESHVAGLRSPARRHREAIREVIRDTMSLKESQALRVGGRLF